MEINQLMMPLLGGMLIGFSASLLLLMQGRVFGISGILGGVLLPKKGDILWRIAVLLGFLGAGIILRIFLPESMAVDAKGSLGRMIVAGLLVGFGTQLGSGCTSGHGVCGISRLSPRSILATITFIGSGMMVVAVVRALGGLS
jgi:uncharacterized membrane protein YedE/YeeE